ncbi:MAG: hypothetical protein ACTSPE_11505 [Candidatus Thorarchaeota archaeon]
MHLQENADLFAKRIRLLDPDADRHLAREFMELHEDKCTRCQEDRLGCTVRPACKDRNFLNMLVEIGVPPRDLPSFCYSQYLVQIRRYILEKKGRGMADRRIPINDLLSALKMSSIRQFTTRFNKLWSRRARIREGDTLLVAGDNLLFHFDFARGIVELNPWHKEVQSFEMFDRYVRLLSQYHGVKAETFDATLNWWVLTVSVGSVDRGRVEKGLSELRDKFEALHLVELDAGTAIQAEVVAGGSELSINVGALRMLFSLASEGSTGETRA